MGSLRNRWLCIVCAVVLTGEPILASSADLIISAKEFDEMMLAGTEEEFDETMPAGTEDLTFFSEVLQDEGDPADEVIQEPDLVFYDEQEIENLTNSLPEEELIIDAGDPEEPDLGLEDLLFEESETTSLTETQISEECSEAEESEECSEAEESEGCSEEDIITETQTENEQEAAETYSPDMAGEGVSLRVTEWDPDTYASTDRLVNSIDFGTIDLSEGPYIEMKYLWYKNTSTGSDPDTGSTPMVTISDCYIESTSEANRAASAFCGGPRASSVGYGLGGTAGTNDYVRLDVTSLLAGTYTAYYHIPTTPGTVKGNAGAIANDPESGDLIIPVRVKLTGKNANLPDRVENLRAQAANSSVVLSWDHIKGFTDYYNIYRRDGEETGADPDHYDFSLYEWIGSTSGAEQATTYIDDTAVNGQSYSYFVIGSEPYHGYPSEAAAAVPTDRLYYRPKAPHFSAGGRENAVLLEWSLAEDPMYPDFPEGYASGSGVIDHFNIYRNGVLAAQVDQDTCRRWPAENKYEWSLEIPCEDRSSANQQVCYSWWVTAVAVEELGGLEGYESIKDDASPYTMYPVIESYSAIWDGDGTVSLACGTDFGETLKVWRDGTFLGELRDEYNNALHFTDETAMAGKTYTYRMAAVGSSGNESAPVSLTVKTPANDAWVLESPNIRYEAEMYLADGTTPTISMYAYPDVSYRVYCNGMVAASYGKGSSVSGKVVFRDTPSEDGTYIYYVEKEEGGVKTCSQQFVFIKEPETDQQPEKPQAPKLSARIVGQGEYKGVRLDWQKAAVGAEPEGYYIYRTDAGAYNTLAFSNADGQAEYRKTNIWGASEPAKDRYFRRYAPGTSYTDENIGWNREDEYPHQYWVCAYNRYGISEPSNIITFELLDEDEDGQPDLPGNADTLAPDAPVITKLSMRYHPDYYGTAAYGYYGYLDVAWEKAPTGGEVDHYEVFFDRLLENGEYETDSYSPDKYPGVSGEDGELSTYDLMYFPNDYGQYRIRIAAENAAGTAMAEQTCYVGGIPDLTAAPAQTPEGKTGAAAVLTWTGLYKDESQVTGYEIWRKGEYGIWEKLPYEPGPEESTYTDYGLNDRETYRYFITAKTTDEFLPLRKSVERSVKVYAGYGAPAAPVLHEPVLTGGKEYPDLLLSWEAPSAGTPSAYYLKVKKDLNGVEGEWKDYLYYDGRRHTLLGRDDEEGEVEEQMYLFYHGTWYPPSYDPYDTISYRLQAVNSEGESAWSNVVTVRPQEIKEAYRQTYTDAPAYYIMPSAVPGDTTVTLSWNKASASGFAEAVYYGIYRYPAEIRQGTSPWDWQPYVWVDTAHGTNVAKIPADQKSYTFTDHELENGQMYAYEVEAYSAGGQTYYSVYGTHDGRITVTPEGKTSAQKIAARLEKLISDLPSPDFFDPADASQAGSVSEVAAVYDGLTDEQKDAIDQAERAKLMGLLDKMREAKDQAQADLYAQEAAQVQTLIDALPEADSLPADLFSVGRAEELLAVNGQAGTAREAYNALPEAAAQKWVDVGRLTSLEQKLFTMKRDSLDQAAVLAMIGLLRTVPSVEEVTTQTAEGIYLTASNVRLSWQTMLPRRKKLLAANDEGAAALANLSAVEEKISSLKEQIAAKQKEDRAAAAGTMRLIDAIGEISDIALQDVESIREAAHSYEQLTDDQKAIIPPSVKGKLDLALEIAEKLVLADALSQRMLALHVEEINVESGEEIRSIRADYEKSSDEVKAMVSPAALAQLSAAEEMLGIREREAEGTGTPEDEEALEALLKKQKDITAAKEVEDLIAGLPHREALTLEDAALVQAAVDRYNSLTDDQKDLVSEEAKTRLTRTQEQVEVLREEAARVKPMTLYGSTMYTRMASAGAFRPQISCSATKAVYSWSSSDPSVARVDAKGTVTPLKAGTAVITVKASCTGYAQGELKVTIKVTGLTQGASGVYGSGASKGTYKVTAADTVTYVKCKASKKSKTLSVPEKITINGASYRVTAVGAKAFSGFSKVKKLSIGANVVSIGSSAFQKCKALKTLTVRSARLTKNGCKKSLKGSSVRTVKVPGASRNACKKIFTKKICGKKVNVK